MKILIPLKYDSDNSYPKDAEISLDDYGNIEFQFCSRRVKMNFKSLKTGICALESEKDTS